MMNVLAALIVLILPGLAWLAWLERRSPDVFCRLADAVGLSVSLSAVFWLVFFVLGVPPGWLGGAVFYAVALLVLAAALLRGRVTIPPLDGQDCVESEPKKWQSLLGTALGVALLTAAVAWRFYQARQLAFPAWVDSIQHTLIVRQIIETGGLPETLLPYMNAPFYYHYGFHLITAIFAQWSGMLPDQAVLWLGQVIHALVGLGMYRFARSMGLARRAALSAALLTSFVMQMPAYYLTWGRFTLLTGLVVLLPAMAATLDLRRDPQDRGAQLRLGALTAGLCLTHYLALLLLLLFLGVMGIERIVKELRHSSRFSVKALLRFAFPVLVGGLIGLPWLVRVFTYQPHTVDVVLPGESTTDWNYLAYLLGPRYSHILMSMAVVGFVLCVVILLVRLLRKQQPAVDTRAAYQSVEVQGVFAFWTLLLLVLALPFGLRLGPFRPDHYVIVLFFPASIWLAIVLADASAAVERYWGKWAGWGALVLVLGLLVGWGLRESRSVLNPVTLLADRVDRAALDWINQNTPPSAKFYINAAHWQSGAYRGVDGGAWIVPYTGRGALIPPISYMWTPSEEYTQINQWAVQTESLHGCTPDFWKLVREAGLTHVYLRKGRGTLQPEMLADCPRLREIYREGGVWIYEIQLP